MSAAALRYSGEVSLRVDPLLELRSLSVVEALQAKRRTDPGPSSAKRRTLMEARFPRRASACLATSTTYLLSSDGQSPHRRFHSVGPGGGPAFPATGLLLYRNIESTTAVGGPASEEGFSPSWSGPAFLP